MQRAESRGAWSSAIAPAAVWAAGFLFTFATAVIHNDHFDRVSRARQVARYGELPFRDFLDPGYFLNEFSSAAFQLVFGDRLLGEVLLNASFIATGGLVVFLLACRVTGSVALALGAWLLAALTMPRAYDYDKVLFYPLGVLLCWRYVHRQRARDLLLLGVGIVVAALFRYDTGVYVGFSALVAIMILHARDWRAGTRALVQLAGAAAVALAPFLVFIHLTAGIGHALDQMLTYGVRESEPFQIFVTEPPPSQFHVRWAAAVKEDERLAAVEQHGLQGEVRRGDPEDRTWSYRMDDPTPERLRALLADPRVEDTHLIDREKLALPGEPLWTRLEAALPILQLRVRPDMYDNRATAVLYFSLMLLPIVAALVLIVSGGGSSVERAFLWSLVAMCAVLNLFIMRAPVAARIGGMAGPAAVLAAWLVARVRDTVPSAGRAWDRIALFAARATAAAGLAVLVWSIAGTADWRNRLTGSTLDLGARWRVFTASPPSPSDLSMGRVSGLVSYVRDCTTPEDRVFATWFVPELYFLAQRGFAGASAATFASHWSEDRFQQRSLEALRSQSVPIVLVETRTYDLFRSNRPTLDAYFLEHYSIAGESTFGDEAADPGAYRVLVHKGRAASGKHPQFALPCFT